MADKKKDGDSQGDAAVVDERALIENERTFRSITENAPDYIFIKDRSRRYTFVNPAMRELVGLPEGELLGKTPEEVFGPEQGEIIREVDDRAFAGETVDETKPLVLGGEEFYFHTVQTPLTTTDDGEVTSILGVVRDITERKYDEDQLRFLSTVVKQSTEGMAIVDLDGNLKYVNDAWRAMHGFEKDEELIGRNLSLFHTKEQLKRDVAPFNELVKKEGTHSGEVGHVTRDGRPFPTLMVSTMLRNDEGDPIGLVGIAKDVTDLKRAEEKLRASEERLRSVFRAAPTGIGVVVNRVIKHVNERLCDMLGYAEDELVDQSVRILYATEEDFERVGRDKYEQIKKRGTGTVETRWSRKDGTLIDVLVSSTPMDLDDWEKGVTFTALDITERKRMEESLVQTEKMMSVGGLAAGMAHEINNPLAGMMQTAEVLSSRLTEDLPVNEKAAAAVGTTMTAIRAFMEARGVPEMLERIRSSGERAAEIVSNMLSFAHKSESGFMERDLTELLDDVVDIAGSDYNLKKQYDFRQIKIVREYDENLPPVRCEASEIQQVMLNILRNGAEAMAESQAPGESRFVLRLIGEKNGKWVRVEIQDNGPGLDETTRKRVFEPFFTTKPVGEGTGLGLSVSYFIVVDKHGGEISVQSEPGRGTTFIVRLPLEKDRTRNVD